MKQGLRLGVFGVAAIGVMVAANPAAAQDKREEYHLEEQDLGDALRAVGRISGREVMFPSDLVEGKRSPRIDGMYTAGEAIERLITGSGLIAADRGGSILIRGRSETARAAVSSEASDRSDIVVTGSRIRGAPIASPAIQRTREQFRDAGLGTLQDALATIPQNFGGGQNVGVGIGVPEDKGVNLGASSTLNLRGLGSDATLTLLNGHRLAYNSLTQGIDMSTIPLAAIERVEIVADGASALYGSDAVGGVANIILRRDYDGIETSARFGASTDGGNEQQQYSLVGGTRWSNGGFIATYDFFKNTPIVARQRDYTAGRSPGLTLYPFTKRHNVTVSGHQEITQDLELRVDAVYNKRRSHLSFAATALGDYSAFGTYSAYENESYSIAPSLNWRSPSGLRLSLSGLVGADRSHYDSTSYTNGAVSSHTIGCYCNTAKAIEISADGDLFTLPAGPMKIALGGGYRANDFHGYRTLGTAQNINVTQDSYFAYGELNLPIFAPGQETAGLYSLNFSAAVRYERYPGVDDVVTPKLGVIYAPTSELTFKGSWGRSFKAPTLYQQFNAKGASLYPAAVLGATGYPANAAALILTGGNEALKPERATTWTITGEYRPSFAEGLRLELSYFNVKYRDRVVAPITYLLQAFTNPIYADLVDRNPSAADKAAAIDGALFFNYTGIPYDPANLAAIIYDTNTNAAKQNIHGVDAQLQYPIHFGDSRTLTLDGGASYLHSSQRLSSLQPTIPLAGTLFNPPHFRARAGATWADRSVSLAAFANYIGSVNDTRFSPSPRVSSMTTLDLTARYRSLHSAGLPQGLDLILSIQNALNDKPGSIVTSQSSQTPFDSTNYSAIGRYVSLTVSKHW